MTPPESFINPRRIRIHGAEKHRFATLTLEILKELFAKAGR
jgi:hypothetical protein